MKISDAAELWLGELARQGRQPSTTIYTYRKILDRLADRYDPRDVDEISLTMLRKFLDEEATNRKAFRERGEVVRVGPSRVGQQVSTLKGFFYWLWDEGYIPDDPAHKLRRPKQPKPEENDGIVSVTAEDVQRLLAACHSWPERLCLNVLIYTGARRRAVANLRLSDYDATSEPPTLTFREKGGKVITKPVARPLAQLLDEAFMAGVWDLRGRHEPRGNPVSGPRSIRKDDLRGDALFSQRSDEPVAGDPSGRCPFDPWLIPPRSQRGWPETEGYQKRRSDTIVYRIVKAVAARAGVDCHVHSLRGAFAVQFLEQHPDRIVALQALMGHTQMETTRVYLRRLDRRREMEAVVDLNWGPSSGSGDTGTPDPAGDGSALTAASSLVTESPRSLRDLPDVLLEECQPPMPDVQEAERRGSDPGGSE